MIKKSTFVLVAFLIGLSIFCWVLLNRLRAVADDRDLYAGLAKAYAAASEDNDGVTRAFSLRVKDLESSNDSLLRRLDSLRKEMGVKDRRLMALHYRQTVVERRDTIVVPEPVFSAGLDTVIDDGWVRTSLSLRDTMVAIGTRVRNETSLVVSSRRETVRPPRRFFLFRLFQRKHTVVTVEARENNPWCETRETRSVEIIE